MAKIRHEISLLNSSTGGNSVTNLNWEERIFFDRSRFNGSLQYFFQIGIASTGTLSSTQIINFYINDVLYESVTCKTDNSREYFIINYEITNPSTITALEDSAGATIRFTINAPFDGINKCNFIIIQNTLSSPILNSEDQYEIVNRTTISSNTTIAPLSNNPKYWYYDPNAYSSNTLFEVEAIYSKTSSMSSTYIYLQQDDGAGGNWTNYVSPVLGGTATIVSRGRQSFQPTPYRSYRMAAYNSSNMDSYSVFCGKIIATQWEVNLDPKKAQVIYYIYGGNILTNNAIAQLFYADNQFTLSSGHFVVGKLGNPTDALYYGIKSNLSGSYLSSGYISPSNVANTGPITITGTYSPPITISGNVPYYLVFLRSGARDTSNCLGIYTNNDFITDKFRAFDLTSGYSWAYNYSSCVIGLYNSIGITKLRSEYLACPAGAASNYPYYTMGKELTYFNPDDFSGVNFRLYSEFNGQSAASKVGITLLGNFEQTATGGTGYNYIALSSGFCFNPYTRGKMGPLGIPFKVSTGSHSVNSNSLRGGTGNSAESGQAIAVEVSFPSTGKIIGLVGGLISGISNSVYASVVQGSVSNGIYSNIIADSYPTYLSGSNNGQIGFNFPTGLFLNNNTVYQIRFINDGTRDIFSPSFMASPTNNLFPLAQRNNNSWQSLNGSADFEGSIEIKNSGYFKPGYVEGSHSTLRILTYVTLITGEPSGAAPPITMRRIFFFI